MIKHYLRLNPNNYIEKIVTDKYDTILDSDVFYCDDYIDNSNSLLELKDSLGNLQLKWIHASDNNPSSILLEEKDYRKSIDDLIKDKYDYIDKLVAAEISNGFLFDGFTFSLSQNAQLNWINIKTNKLSITFPLRCSMRETPFVYELTEVEADNFYNTYISTIDAIIETARRHKLAISTKTTHESIIGYCELLSFNWNFVETNEVIEQ